MTKLSPKMQREYDYMKIDIDIARRYDNFIDYEIATSSFFSDMTRKETENYVNEHYDFYKLLEDDWHKHRDGLVLSTAGKPTLEALEKRGLIEIVQFSDSRNQSIILDWVKVLNY